jgi:ABC-type oligopeptide transport system ATPase subunit
LRIFLEHPYKYTSGVVMAHDLNMVRHISDKIGVMYLGKMVEIASSQKE